VTEAILTESTEAEEAEPGKPEVVWASKGSLPQRPWRDVELPVMGVMVRVRFLSNVEATQLALLPDLSRFALLMSQLQTGDRESSLSDEEARELQKERVHYMTRLAHLCVVDQDEPPMERACVDCGLVHGPSLWTGEQTTFLAPEDLATIASTAERGWELERVAPLSKGPTESTSSPPADIGESTPPTNS